MGDYICHAAFSHKICPVLDAFYLSRSFIYFQVLFTKLTQIAGIATEMFVGRERFATVLLMRLTEAVILWLSEDQTFWEGIEEGPEPLGPLGLQQVHFHNSPFPTKEKRSLLTISHMLKMIYFGLCAVLFGYGVCDTLFIPRPLLVSKSASSYQEHHS